MRRMMPETGECGIQSVVELRRNLRRASMDYPHKVQVRGMRKADEPHSQSDPNEPTEPRAGEREQFKKIHAPSVRRGTTIRRAVLDVVDR